VKRIGIVVALPAEARSLYRKGLPTGKPFPLDDRRLVIVSGAGPAAAAHAAGTLAAAGVDGLVGWGCAAALSPRLRPGDLILPTAILSAQDESLTTSASWTRHVAHRLAGRTTRYDGPLAGSDGIVASAADKRDRFQRTGALALDMESAALARSAQAHALPFLAVRAIADPADMDLPASIQVAMDDRGQVRLARLFGHALRQPGDFIGMARLGFHFRAAMGTLKTVASLGAELIP